MVITDTINKNILGWVTLGVVIVVGSIVLLGIKNANIGGSICPGANSSHTVVSSSNDACCLAIDNCAGANTSATSSLGGTIDNFVTGISEPENWVAIVIIAIIGFAILGIFLKKSKE